MKDSGLAGVDLDEYPLSLSVTFKNNWFLY